MLSCINDELKEITDKNFKDLKKLYGELLMWIEYPARNKSLPPGSFMNNECFEKYLAVHDHACRCHRNAIKLGKFFKVSIKNRKQAIKFLERNFNFNKRNGTEMVQNTL